MFTLTRTGDRLTLTTVLSPPVLPPMTSLPPDMTEAERHDEAAAA